jgi:hypothetical protein
MQGGPAAHQRHGDQSKPQQQHACMEHEASMPPCCPLPTCISLLSCFCPCSPSCSWSRSCCSSLSSCSMRLTSSVRASTLHGSVGGDQGDAAAYLDATSHVLVGAREHQGTPPLVHTWHLS